MVLPWARAGAVSTPCPRRRGPDQRDRLLHLLLLEPERSPDVVMAGLHDDQRWRQRAQVNPRDLVGDRPVMADVGAYIARPGVPVYDRVPVQQAGQQHGP